MWKEQPFAPPTRNKSAPPVSVKALFRNHCFRFYGNCQFPENRHDIAWYNPLIDAVYFAHDSHVATEYVRIHECAHRILAASSTACVMRKLAACTYEFLEALPVYRGPSIEIPPSLPAVPSATPERSHLYLSYQALTLLHAAAEPVNELFATLVTQTETRSTPPCGDWSHTWAQSVIGGLTTHVDRLSLEKVFNDYQRLAVCTGVSTAALLALCALDFDVPLPRDSEENKATLLLKSQIERLRLLSEQLPEDDNGPYEVTRRVLSQLRQNLADPLSRLRWLLCQVECFLAGPEPARKIAKYIAGFYAGDDDDWPYSCEVCRYYPEDWFAIHGHRPPPRKSAEPRFTVYRLSAHTHRLRRDDDLYPHPPAPLETGFALMSNRDSPAAVKREPPLERMPLLQFSEAGLTCIRASSRDVVNEMLSLSVLEFLRQCVLCGYVPGCICKVLTPRRFAENGCCCAGVLAGASEHFIRSVPNRHRKRSCSGTRKPSRGLAGTDRVG